MPAAQYLVLDPAPPPHRAPDPFASAPPAAPLTPAEADAVRRTLAAHGRTLRRAALALVPAASGLGASLGWWFAVSVREGSPDAGEALVFAAVAVVWNALVVYRLWLEALAVAPGAAPALPAPRSVVGEVVSVDRVHRHRKATLHRVRFPSHWSPPRGRARLRVLVPPRPRGATTRFGRAPLVLGVETDPQPPASAAPPPAAPAASVPAPPAPSALGPPANRTRGRWRWDPVRRALVPISTSRPPAASGPTSGSPAAPRAAPARPPDASLAEDLSLGIGAAYPLF